MTDAAILDPHQAEAFATLIDQVGRKSTKIPAEKLVQHVMRIVPADEWPVRVAAMDALLRRLEFAHRDELRIESRPEGGKLLGPYGTRRKGSSGTRPYRTVIQGVEPMSTSCDCPDFVQNSLGLCKHTLTVLESIYEKPRRLDRALREQESLAANPRVGLSWDPIRPLSGAGDWLERVVYHPTLDGKAPTSEKRARALARFKPLGGSNVWALAGSHTADPVKRLRLVDDLLVLMPSRTARATDAPALRSLLQAERTRLGRIVAHAVTKTEIRAAYKRIKRPLYPYQREGVERFLATGSLLLADDMGLGKTAQAIASVDLLMQTKRVHKALLIVPASLKPQWVREWAAFSDLPIIMVEGSPTERQATYQSTSSGVLLINYEQLIRDVDTVMAWVPGVVVLDEAQRIKNWATKTAHAVKRLSPPFRLVLTGTPMENRVEELASIVEWVNTHAIEPKWRLSAYHSVRADGRSEIVGVRNLDTLRVRLRPCMVRRVRQDVLDQLPPRTDTRIPVEMSAPQREEHDSLIAPIASILQRASKRALTQPEFLRLMSLLTTQRIISNGLAQLRFQEVWPALSQCSPEESVIQGLSAPKLLELRQIVRQVVLEQGRKVVIFSQWRRMLALAHWSISDLLQGEKLRAGFFTGAEGQRRRTQNIVEFHDDPQFRILLASDAGGVGLNLQRAANCVINLELPWNPAVLEQRIGRIYRLGQEQPIDVYNLISEQGIESRIASLVGTKQAFFKGLFDGESDAIQFEQSGSFLSKVQTIYGEQVVASGSTTDDFEIAELPDPDTESDEIDAEVTDPFAPMIDAGDESLVSIQKERAEVGGEPASVAATPPLAASTPVPSAVDVRDVLSKLKMRREPDGRVLIEAEPEAVSALGALFEGMAAMLQALAKPTEEQAQEN